MSDVVRAVTSRAEKDCAIVALANCYDRPYEDVLALTVAVTRERAPHNRALWCRELRLVAAQLGAPLRLRRRFDLETAEGIVWFSTLASDDEDHVAFVRAGLVFGMDARLWAVSAYLEQFRYRPHTLFERER